MAEKYLYLYPLPTNVYLPCLHTPQQIVCYQLDPSKLSVSMNNKEIGKCSCITCSKVSYLKIFPLAYSKLYKCSMRMLVHLPLLHHPLLVCFSGNFSMSLYQCIQALGRIKHMTKRINICLFRAHNLLALLVRVV